MPELDKDKYATLTEPEIKKYIGWLKAKLYLRPAYINQLVNAILNVPKIWLNDPKTYNDNINKLSLSKNERLKTNKAVKIYFPSTKKPKYAYEIKKSKIPKKSHVEYFYLIDEINAVRKVCNEPQFLMHELLFQLGIRRGILMRITPAHISFEKRMLYVPKEMQGNKSGVDWTIEMPYALLRRLRRHIIQSKIPNNHIIFKIYYYKEHSKGGRGVRPPKFIVNPADKKGMKLYSNQDIACTLMFEYLGKQAVRPKTDNHGNVILNKGKETMVKLNLDYPYRPHIIRHSSAVWKERAGFSPVALRENLQQIGFGSTGDYRHYRRKDREAKLPEDKVSQEKFLEITV